MKKVKCPRCKKESLFSPENPSRPFCSERCKLIDLGEWSSEEYKIAGEEQKGSSHDDPDTHDPETQLH